MAVKARTQITLGETIVENKELENLLEQRQELKQSVSDYHKTDKEAKEKIRSIETPVPYRVGRFIISHGTIPPKTVSFETGETIRINIKTVDGE